MTDADLLRTPAELKARDLSEGLANSAGLSRILGISSARASTLTAREDFPDPIPLVGGPDRYRGALVWPVAEVKAWDEQRKTTPPRPKPRKPRRRKPRRPVEPLYPPPGPVEIPPRP